MTRKEFLSWLITQVFPYGLAMLAVGTALAVYQIARSPDSGYHFLLLLAVVWCLLYPTLKRRYGQSVWSRLPRPVQQLLSGLRMVALLLWAVLTFLVYLSMPLLLVILCIQLLIENYRLAAELERRNVMEGGRVDA